MVISESRVCMNCANSKIEIDKWGMYTRDNLTCLCDGSLHHRDQDTCEQFTNFPRNNNALK